MQNSQLQLSRSAIRRIMEEADLDHNGKIEYREYAPVSLACGGHRHGYIILQDHPSNG